MDRKRLIEKIQALLKLTESPNENEATAAAKKAQDLMATYSLSMAEVDVSEESGTEVIHEQFEFSKNNVLWKLTLATGIAKANNVECFAGRNIQDRTDRRKCIHFIGRSGLIAGCKALYTYLSEMIERECKRQMVIEKSKSYNQDVSWRSWGDSFRKGMASRIRDRLAERKKEMESADNLHEPIGSAIVRQNMSAILKRENEAFLRGMGVRTGAIGSTMGSASGRKAGMAAGDRAGLGGQLKGSAAPTRQRAISGR